MKLGNVIFLTLLVAVVGSGCKDRNQSAVSEETTVPVIYYPDDTLFVDLKLENSFFGTKKNLFGSELPQYSDFSKLKVEITVTMPVAELMPILATKFNEQEWVEGTWSAVISVPADGAVDYRSITAKFSDDGVFTEFTGPYPTTNIMRVAFFEVSSKKFLDSWSTRLGKGEISPEWSSGARVNQSRLAADKLRVLPIIDVETISVRRGQTFLSLNPSIKALTAKLDYACVKQKDGDAVLSAAMKKLEDENKSLKGENSAIRTKLEQQQIAIDALLARLAPEDRSEIEAKCRIPAVEAKGEKKK